MFNKTSSIIGFGVVLLAMTLLATKNVPEYVCKQQVDDHKSPHTVEVAELIAPTEHMDEQIKLISWDEPQIPL